MGVSVWVSKVANVHSTMQHVTTITKAYDVCRRITFTHAKTFAFASRFIPRAKRNACYAVYAFCRYVDDVIDVAMEQGDLSMSDALTVIAQWQSDLDALYAGLNTESAASITERDAERNSILLAWEDTLKQYSIPRNLPNELIEGVLMDTTITRFATFEELRNYCYKVASVVGLMTSEIFGYSNSVALHHAVDLGIAMQLTNIIRDVKEDAERGRIYLALEDMEKYGVSENDILTSTFTPDVQRLLTDYVTRARQLYTSANKGIPYLDRTSRPTVMLMSRNYEHILDVVEGMNYNVFLGRARTSLATKLASLPAAVATLFWKTHS